MKTVKIERDSAEWERTLRFQEQFIQWWGVLSFALMTFGFTAVFIFAYGGLDTMAIVMGIVSTIGTVMFAITPGWKTIAESDLDE